MLFNQFPSYSQFIGLRIGMADVMVGARYSGEWGMYQERLIFDITFFFIVNVLLMDIVFGIIIDTFAGLRDEQ